MIFNRNNYIKNSRQVTTLSDIGIKNIKFAIEAVQKHFFLEAKNSKNYFLQVGLGRDCWRTSQTCPV